jgi:hypothetical protein
VGAWERPFQGDGKVPLQGWVRSSGNEVRSSFISCGAIASGELVKKEVLELFGYRFGRNLDMRRGLGVWHGIGEL